MSKVWLAVGMFLSLVVPVGFVVWTNLAEDRPSRSITQPSGEVTYEYALAVSDLRTGIKDLKRLNKSKEWGESESSQADLVRDSLRHAARELQADDGLEDAALRGADFAKALKIFGEAPTQQTYELYEKARSALNNALQGVDELTSEQ